MIHKAVNVKTTALCGMIPCSLLNWYEPPVQIAAEISSETSIPLSRTTRRHFPGDIFFLFFITNMTLICYSLSQVLETFSVLIT